MCTGKVVLGLESTHWHCECSFMVETLSSMCKTIGSVSCKETKQQQKASKQELTKFQGGVDKTLSLVGESQKTMARIEDNCEACKIFEQYSKQIQSCILALNKRKRNASWIVKRRREGSVYYQEISNNALQIMLSEYDN